MQPSGAAVAASGDTVANVPAAVAAAIAAAAAATAAIAPTAGCWQQCVINPYVRTRSP